MATKPTVLVVGSTGMLGFKIVSALLAKGASQVRVMVRSRYDSNEQNRQKIDEINTKGVAIVEGDLMKE
jgi:nucleoside-diphosphate-sugar epimerase